MIEKNYSAFEGLNTNNARMENETREQYKARLKAVKQAEKLYFKVGREAFQQMFPNGIGEAMKNSAEEALSKNNPPSVKIDGHTLEGVELERNKQEDSIAKSQ